MRVQRNLWDPERYAFQPYTEAEVIEGDDVKLVEQGRNHITFVGTRYWLIKQRGDEPAEFDLTMEGCDVSYYGGSLMVCGFVEVTPDPPRQGMDHSGEFRKELWIVIEP